MIHPLPAEEALYWARLHQREQARRAERDHLADTSVKSPGSRYLASAIDDVLRVTAVTMFLIGLLSIGAR